MKTFSRVAWLHRKVLVATIAVASSTVTVDGVAQETPDPTGSAGASEIEEVLVTGTLSPFGAIKTDTPITELARSISIETQQDLLNKGALNLNDAYVYSAGVTGEQFGFSTRADTLAVRGLSVPEYRDSLQALFGNFNNARPDIYTIEQVEILKGPASVLYGQGTPGGLVNVVSKRAQADLPSEIVVEAGNFNRGQLAADLNGSINDQLHFRVVGVYRDTNTQVDQVFEESLTLAPSVTWTPGEDTTLTLLGNLRRSDSDTASQFHPIDGTLRPAPNGEQIPFDAYLGEPSFNRFDTDSDSVTLLLEHDFNEVWSVESTARWMEGSSDYAQAWQSFSILGGDRYARNPDGTLYEDGNSPRSWFFTDRSSDQIAFDTRFRAKFSTGPVDHQLLMGLQYQDVETDEAGGFIYALGLDILANGPNAGVGDTFWNNPLNPVPTGLVPDQALFDAVTQVQPTEVTKDLGIYVNNQFTWGNWHLTAGVRFDEAESEAGASEQDDDATSLAFGLLYETAFGLSPYISYAESFEPVVGLDQVTQRQLKPQEGEQVEFGIKYQSEDGRIFVTLARYDIEISNLANPNALPNANSQQEGVSEIDGVELEALFKFAQWSLELNANTIDMTDPNGFQFASVPEEQASVWAMWQPTGVLNGFRSGVGVRYVGASQNGADSLETPSYTVGDLLIGYGRNRWDFALNVRNLADKEFESTCLARGDCFFGDARTIVGRATYRF
ncbi:MAG: TonB-dependent siderophore receptor [Pseudomonadota bacterium]